MRNKSARKGKKRLTKKNDSSFPASSSARSSDYKNRLKGCRITAFIALIILLLFNVPWLSRHFGFDLDSSWVFVLHEAFIGHYAFGRDILWHYGPLGFLFAKYYHPATYAWMLAAWAMLSCILWVAAYRVAIRASDTPDPLVMPVVAILVVMTYESMFFLLPTLLFLLHYHTKPDSVALRILLICGIAVSSLVKISYLAFGCGILIIMDVHRLFSARAIPWMFPLYVTLTFLLWLLCGQSVGDIPSFLYAGMEHTAGFGIMAQDDSSPILLPYYLFLCAFILAAAGAAWWNTMNKKAIVPLICLLFLLFTLLKVGFVNNNDHHKLQTFGTVLVLLLLIRDSFWPRTPHKAKVLLCAISLLAIISYSFRAIRAPEHYEERRQTLAVKQKPASPPIFTLHDLLARHTATFQNMLNDTRTREPLPKVAGGADLLSAHQVALFASGNRYAPRPIFQGYHAYTPYLAYANRAFLQSEKAPEHLFFTVDVVQSRFPSQDDGLLWPEIFARYDIAGIHGNYLHLKKRQEIRPVGQTAILSYTTNMGSESRVPPLSEDGVIWVKMHADPTLLGRFARLIFRNANLYIRYATNSGYSDTRRLVSATAGEGFVLSPIIGNNLLFALMMGGDFPALSPLGIRAITILPEPGLEWLAPFLYKKDIRLEFFRLRFLHQDLATIPGWNSDLETLARLTSYPFHSAIAAPDDVTDQHISISRAYDQNAVRVNGEARLYYPLNGYEKTVEAVFGMYDAFSHRRLPGDGMYFSIEGVEKETEVKHVLWKAFVSSPQGTELVRKTLRVPLQKEFKGLFFNTAPVSPEKSNRGYWADVRVE